jgi:hypothetical protein
MHNQRIKKSEHLYFPEKPVIELCNIYCIMGDLDAHDHEAAPQPRNTRTRKPPR